MIIPDECEDPKDLLDAANECMQEAIRLKKENDKLKEIIRLLGET